MQIQSLIPLLDGGSIVISTSSYLINRTPIIVGYILSYDSQLKYEGIYHYVDDVKTVTKGELLTTDELEQLKSMLFDYHKQSELKQIILDFLNNKTR